MELIKSIVLDFCLFSLIEGIFLCIFFEKIYKCEKFKLNEILLLSFNNCIISKIFPPIIYQILMVIWVGLYISKIKNIQFLNCIKSCISFSLLLLIIEMLFCILIENLFNIDFSKLNYFNLFLVNIPLKTLEFFIIKRGDFIEMVGWRS